MNPGNILVKSEMIAMANEAIAVLQQNVSDLATVNDGLFNALNDNIITGTLGTAVGEHLMGLIQLNSSFANLMTMDIQDYSELINILSALSDENEIIDGAAIDNDIYDCEVNIIHYQSLLNSQSVSWIVPALTAYQLAQRTYYNGRIAWYNRRINKLHEKQELFDSIVAATANLFDRNDELRSVIREGYTYIGTEWNGDVCTIPQPPLEAAAWRTELSRINEEYINRYAEQYYSFDEDGNLVINWDEVSLVYQEDPENVNAYQYLALARMYSLASDEDIETAFSEGSIFDPNAMTVTISETFGTSLDYYRLNSLYSVDQNLWGSDDNVTRSTACVATYEYIVDVNDYFLDSYEVSFNPSFNTNNGAVYSYDINVRFHPCSLMPTSADYSRCSQVSGTISVYSYSSTSALNYSALNSASDLTDGLGGMTLTDIITNPGAFFSDPDNFTGIVIELGGYLPNIGDGVGLTGYLYDYRETLNNRSNADNALDLMSFSCIANNTYLEGNLVVIDTEVSDSYELRNSNMNEAALESELNCDNGYNDNHEPITYAQLHDGYNQFMDEGADISLLSPTSQVPTDNPFVIYMRWRNGGGN